MSKLPLVIPANDFYPRVMIGGVYKDVKKQGDFSPGFIRNASINKPAKLSSLPQQGFNYSPPTPVKLNLAQGNRSYRIRPTTPAQPFLVGRTGAESLLRSRNKSRPAKYARNGRGGVSRVKSRKRNAR